MQPKQQEKKEQDLYNTKMKVEPLYLVKATKKKIEKVRPKGPYTQLKLRFTNPLIKISHA